MDILDQDLIHFWTILNKYCVQYILVGELATCLHGFKHFSGDVDLYINDSHLNRRNIKNAFQQLEINNYELIERIDITTEGINFSLKNGIYLDIMTSLKGIDLSFDECFAMAPVAEIEGVIVPFLHINHLIQNKKCVNRPKDQIDVAELEKIKKILAEERRQT